MRKLRFQNVKKKLQCSKSSFSTPRYNLVMFYVTECVSITTFNALPQILLHLPEYLEQEITNEHLTSNDCLECCVEGVSGTDLHMVGTLSLAKSLPRCDHS